ncbi:MAG: hypothetical protein FD129_1666, partial [bacterium]
MVVLAALVILALALRLRALDWGLPGFAEEAIPFRKAVEFFGAETGRWTLDPRFYNYPTLTVYLQFLWLGAAGLVGSLLGAWSGLSEFRTALALPAPALVMAARGLDAAIGALTLVPVYRLTRSLSWNSGYPTAATAALLSSLVLAVGPVPVAESRVIGTDVPMMLFLALALWYLDGVVRRGGDVEIRKFERWHMATGHFRSINEAGFLFYLSDLLPRALGWPAFVLSIVGIVAALPRRGTSRLVAIFALVAFAWIASWRVAFDRYVLLVVPALSA